jgi:hypothetical protein
VRARSAWITTALLVLLLAGCTTPTPRPTESYPPDPGARTHWELRHRVVDTKGMRVMGQRIGRGEESTSVRLVDPATLESDDCDVTLTDPGQGGPERMVGEKITTTFDGHPAVRNGAGAEADYLMWRLEDESWVEVSCVSFGSETSINRVAAAVDLEPTPIMIPFDLELPDGYAVAAISNDLDQVSARVYVGRVGRQPWSPDAELAISYGAPEVSAPTGQPTTVGGRPVQVDDTTTSPAVWVPEQGRWVFLGVESDDTGPHPDRSSELPALKALAERISFATDVADPATWFAADGVFG